MEIIIDPRFCGPKGSGNGGYVCGLLGREIDGAASVRLMVPPPLGVPIDIRNSDTGVEAWAGDVQVGSARPSSVQVEVPERPADEAINQAHRFYLDHADKHSLPHCFVCGPHRREGDGLRIFAGDIKDSPVNADRWVPDAALADEDGLIAEEFLWAALDCPSYFALRTAGRMCLLGSLTADIFRRPEAGELLTVMAWKTGEDGRKFYSDSAIVDDKGTTLAAAQAIWIEITDPDFEQKLRGE